MEQNILEQIKAIEPNFAPPPCALVGEDRNAFAIMGRVSKSLRRAGYSNLVPLYQKLATSGDYNNLLMVSMEFVENN